MTGNFTMAASPASLGEAPGKAHCLGVEDAPATFLGTARGLSWRVADPVEPPQLHRFTSARDAPPASRRPGPSRN